MPLLHKSTLFSRHVQIELINMSYKYNIGYTTIHCQEIARSTDWIKVSKFVRNQIRTHLECLVRGKVRDFVDSSLRDDSWVAGGETSWAWVEDALINVGAGLEALRVVMVVGLAVAVRGSAINRWSNSDVEAWVEEDHFL